MGDGPGQIYMQKCTLQYHYQNWVSMLFTELRLWNLLLGFESKDLLLGFVDKLKN